jgi:hypothetical protein
MLNEIMKKKKKQNCDYMEDKERWLYIYNGYFVRWTNMSLCQYVFPFIL